MVEQNAVAGIHSETLTVIDRNPIAVKLGHGIRGTRIKRCGFALRRFLNQAKQFGSRSLIKTGLFLQAAGTDSLQKPERPQSVGIGGIFRTIPRNLNMRLCRQIINLVRLNLLDQAQDIRGIRQIAVMQLQPGVFVMTVLIKMINPRCIERRSTALHAVNLISLFQQQLGKIRTVLPSNSSNKRFFHNFLCFLFTDKICLKYHKHFGKATLITHPNAAGSPQRRPAPAHKRRYRYPKFPMPYGTDYHETAAFADIFPYTRAQFPNHLPSYRSSKP